MRIYDNGIYRDMTPEEMDTLRANLRSEQEVGAQSGTVRFSLRPEKVFLFSRTSEERIRFGISPQAGPRAGL